jgi:hypothetical protein
MRMTVKTDQLLQDGGTPEYVYRENSVALCCFCGQKIWQQRISTKKCCPCTVNIACHVKQPSKTTFFEGTLSWRWRGWKSSVRVVPTATTRILRCRFPGTCETLGQVFKFVWRLHWKVNVVCMSLSPFVSLQSRFVTYLLTFLVGHRDRLFHVQHSFSLQPYEECLQIGSAKLQQYTTKIKLTSLA